MITISDPIKKDAASAVDLLKSWGIKVFMLTGDNIRTATAIAMEAHIPRERIFAGVLPKQKVGSMLIGPHNNSALPSSTWTSWNLLRIQLFSYQRIYFLRNI